MTDTIKPGDKFVSVLPRHKGYELLVMMRRADLRHSHIIFFDAIGYSQNSTDNLLIAWLDGMIHSATDIVADEQGNVIIVMLNLTPFYKSLVHKERIP